MLISRVWFPMKPGPIKVLLYQHLGIWSLKSAHNAWKVSKKRILVCNRCLGGVRIIKMSTNDYILFDFIPTKFWLHSVYILTTFRLHSDFIQTAFWLHTHYIVTIFLLHFDYILTTFYILHSACVRLRLFWICPGRLKDGGTKTWVQFEFDAHVK